MRKNSRKAGILLLGLLLAGCAKSVLVKPDFDAGRYHRIAILPFETDSFLSTIGNQITDEILVTVLQKAPDLDFVERHRIDMLMQEQQLVKNGNISQESAIALGRLLGAKAIVTGSVSVSIGDIQPSPLSAQRVASGTATIRFIDTETGKILWAKREEAQYSIFRNSQGRDDLTTMTDHEMVQKVMRELGEKLAKAFYPHYELQ